MLNIRRHGVDFLVAIRIFDGPVVTVSDNRFEYGEDRDVSIGLVDGVLLLTVVHTDRAAVTRIISARRANRAERIRYEKAIRKSFVD